MLRACIKPETVSVIPNAVNAAMFVPDYTRERTPNKSKRVTMFRSSHGNKLVDVFNIIIHVFINEI